MVKKMQDLFDAEGWLSLLGYIISLRAAAFGLSFVLDTADAQRTTLYQTIETFPALTPEVFGWILMLSGLFAFTGYLARSFKWSRQLVKYGSYVQFIVYLFMTALYIGGGYFWYAAAIAAPWVPIVYLISNAFYYLPRRKSIAEERKDYGLPPKD